MTPKERRAHEIRDAAHNRFLQNPPNETKLEGWMLTQTISEGEMHIMLSIVADPKRHPVMFLKSGIDIWKSWGRKVFNMRWDDQGNFKIHAFKRGEWEEKIIGQGPDE